MTRSIHDKKGFQMKKRVSSSIIFAFAIFGSGLAMADDYRPVTASITFDEAMLDTEAGAASVLANLENQAEAACRVVSLVSVGLTVDDVCAQDILVQAVGTIGHPNLAAEYAASSYYAETTSERLQVASK